MLWPNYLLTNNEILEKLQVGIKKIYTYLLNSQQLHKKWILSISVSTNAFALWPFFFDFFTYSLVDRLPWTEESNPEAWVMWINKPEKHSITLPSLWIPFYHFWFQLDPRMAKNKLTAWIYINTIHEKLNKNIYGCICTQLAVFLYAKELHEMLVCKVCDLSKNNFLKKFDYECHKYA